MFGGLFQSGSGIGSLFGGSGSTSGSGTSFSSGGASSGSFGTAMGSFGSAVGDMFNFLGDQAAAKEEEMSAADYAQAAQYAGMEAGMSEYQTALNVSVMQRKIYSEVGGEQAAAAGSGLVAGVGSSANVIAASTRAGGMQSYETAAQGNTQTEGYLQQQKADVENEALANEAASADKTAGIGSLLGGAISLFAGILAL